MDVSIISLFFIISGTVNGYTLFQNLRIIGGEPADIKEFPYQVYLNNDNFVCGGIIISENHILTAAHCVESIQEGDIVQVKAGVTNVPEVGVVREITSRDIRIHPKFNRVSFDYDVSVLILREPLQFSERVALIKLPDESIEVEDGRMATVTGYGYIHPDGPPSQQLLKVVLPTVSTHVCRDIYGDAITERMFCAGYTKGGKDSCQGDSGGPLVFDETLIGIVSTGGACGAPNEPGVYTKVTSVLDFINSVFKE